MGPNPPLLVHSRDGLLLSLDCATLRTNAILYSAVEQGASRNLQAFFVEPLETSARRLAYALDRVVWGQQGTAPLRPIYTNHTAIRFLKTLPGADWFAVADDSITIVRQDGSLVAQWGAPFGLRQLALAPDGRVVTGDSAGFVRLYRPEEMNRVRHRAEIKHQRECRNVSFSPSGDRLAFMDWRREESFFVGASQWGTASALPSRMATPDVGGAYHCFSEAPGYHPATGEFVTIQTNRLSFYDVSGAAPHLHREVLLREKAYSVAFSRTGLTLLASHDKGIDWADIATGQTRPITFPGARMVRVALSADGAVGASMARSKGEEHIVWRTADTAVLWRHAVQDTPYDLALHPSGAFLALSFYEGRTEVWDLRQDKLAQRFPSGSPVWGLRFSGLQGNRLIALSEQREIHIWDWQFGHELLRLRASYVPFAAAFSPDGRTLALASHNPGLTLHIAVPWSTGE